MAASHTPPTRDLACNSGMCPDWESNQWHFSSQAGAQSTERHWPGQKYFYLSHQIIHRWYILSLSGQPGLSQVLHKLIFILPISPPSYFGQPWISLKFKEASSKKKNSFVKFIDFNGFIKQMGLENEGNYLCTYLSFRG